MRRTLPVVCLALVCNVAAAAKIASLEIKNEGPLRLAGDTLVVSLLLEPGEKQATLRVRAYSAKGATGRDFAPVMANGSERDEQGRLLVVRSLAREPADALATLSTEIHVDGKDLDLPDGHNQIQYEVAIVVDGAADPSDVAPTAIWPVYVEKGVRNFPPDEAAPAEPQRSVLEILNDVLKPPAPEPQPSALPEAVSEPSPPGRGQGEGGVSFEDPPQAGPLPIRLRSPQAEGEGVVSKPLLEILSQSLKPLAYRKIRVELPAENQYKRWIYFATNRSVSTMNLQKVVPYRSSYSEYPSEELSYGVAETHVPFDIHKRGALDLGGWAGKNVEQAFTMKKPVLDYTEESFYKSLLKHDVLVYVHGFNNSFEEAIVQASQLRVDIGYQKFQGQVVAFSWPAFGGNVANYRADGARARRSIPAMAEFLRKLVTKNNELPEGDRRSIHLIAHSMGNRVLLGALEQLTSDKKRPLGAGSFGKIFLAAPDLESNNFATLLDSAAKTADRVTVYYSKKDVAIIISELMHWDRRAGKSPRLAAPGEGTVDFICTDGVNTWRNRFGHGYFAGVDQVLTDIAMLLHYDLPPQKRGDCLARSEEGPCCWTFVRPDPKRTPAKVGAPATPTPTTGVPAIRR